MNLHHSLNSLNHRRIFLRGDLKPFVCARPKPNEHGETLSVAITFHSLMIYITATCLSLTFISALILQWKHLHRYTFPKEQRQIIRIIFMPVFFCLIAFLSILFYDDSIYFKPIMHVYEAFCIASLFFLFLEYVCPEEDERAKYLNDLPNKDKKGNVIPGGSQLFFNRTFAVVLQFPLTKTLTTIIEIVTQRYNVFCQNSLSPKYAHFWVQIIDIFIIGGAITAVFRFYGRLQPEFRPKQRALAKLIAFKGIVVFQFLQDIFFGFLNGKTLKPSTRYTYDDLYYGLPMMITALEAFLFSLAFHWAFRSRMYHEEQPFADRKVVRLSIWKAAFDAANPSDIFRGILIAFKLIIVKSSKQGRGLNSLPFDINFKFPSQFGAVGSPRNRERKQELDNMAYEPITQSQRLQPSVLSAYPGAVE